MLHGFSLESKDFDDITKTDKGYIELIPINDWGNKEHEAAAVGALCAMLTHIGLEYGTDFHETSRAYEIMRSYRGVEITGRVNFLIALDLVFSSPKSFQLTSQYEQLRLKSHPKKLDYSYWLGKFHQLLVDTLTDKHLYKEERDKLAPLLCRKLNVAYEQLKAEIVKKGLDQGTINEDFDKSNYLKHPLFQTLSHLMDTYDERYQQAAKQTYPSGTMTPDLIAYRDILKQFEGHVPSAYTKAEKGPAGNRIMVIDADEIRQSREPARLVSAAQTKAL